MKFEDYSTARLETFTDHGVELRREARERFEMYSIEPSGLELFRGYAETIEDARRRCLAGVARAGAVGYVINVEGVTRTYKANGERYERHYLQSVERVELD